MLAANEEGRAVTGFAIREDGTLKETGLNLAVPGAVFLFAA